MDTTTRVPGSTSQGAPRCLFTNRRAASAGLQRRRLVAAENRSGYQRGGVYESQSRRNRAGQNAKAIEIEDIEARVSELERAAGASKQSR